MGLNLQHTQVTLVDHMGSDLSVVNAARVSFDKVSTLTEDAMLKMEDAKLIAYLAKHKHTSPFNHAFVTFRVKAPIFVARQLVKHKFMPWNEVSRRYVDSAPEFYIPRYWRLRAESVKQGSSDEYHEHSNHLAQLVYDTIAACVETYKRLLAENVCPEQARMVLPLASMTDWVWSGSLGAIADMCRLRLGQHSQRESQDVAKQISALMMTLFPVSWHALMNMGEQ